MEWQFDDLYVVQDKKTGLLVLDEARYVERCLWYHGYSGLYDMVKELEETWCIQCRYSYTWYADSDAGADRKVSGIRTCPVGCETVIEDHDDRDPYAVISIYAVGDKQNCIGFLQKVSGYHDTDDWHFFDFSKPETHQWEFGSLVPRESAAKDYENIW